MPSTIDEQIHKTVLDAIASIETNNIDDKIRQTEYLMNLNKILDS